VADRVVVGTTLTAFAMDQVDTWRAWLYECDEVIAVAALDGVEVRYFAAIQVDARGLEPFVPLLDDLATLGAEHFTYSLDDGRTEVTTANRLRHITFGQNLVVDYCCEHQDVTHLLFMAADCAPPPDIIPKMLEMGHPLCAPFIPTYGYLPNSDGINEPVEGYPFPVRRGMASAAAIFIARDVFRRIRWRWDVDVGMTDDPCFEHDARTMLGIPTLVRMDCLATHYPVAIGAIESRGHDMRVVR
jgi:hypothetical protein